MTKQSAFKNFQLFKPRTKYVCKKCNCTYKVVGDTWIEIRKPMFTETGKKSFRVVWLCHAGHKTFRGYSKPINWKKKLGGDMVVDDGRSFRDEDDDIEREYKEMVDYAERMSRSGSGKLFY